MLVNTMEKETPSISNRWFGIPLKGRLKTWMGIEIVSNLCLMVFSIIVLIHVCRPGNYGIILYGNIVLMKLGLILTIILLLVDLAFMALMCVGLYEDDIRKVRVYYYYNISSAVIINSYIVFMYFYAIIGSPETDVLHIIIYPIFAIIYLISDGLKISQVKSKLTKLLYKEQYQFTEIPDNSELYTQLDQKED